MLFHILTLAKTLVIILLIGAGLFFAIEIVDALSIKYVLIRVVAVAISVLLVILVMSPIFVWSAEEVTSSEVVESYEIVQAKVQDTYSGKGRYRYFVLNTETKYRYYHLKEDGGILMDEAPVEDSVIYCTDYVPHINVIHNRSATIRQWHGLSSETDIQEWTSYELYIPDGSIASSFDLG